jgi:regulator of ribonuclease activity A
MQRTTDISDYIHPQVQYLEPIYQHYGAKVNFSGVISTVKCFEDNSLIRETLSGDGKGKVLVVDGGGSKSCAMLGDQMATIAINNGWEGVVIYGMIRDSDIIESMQIGIRAIGTHPLKSVKNGVGDIDLEVNFSGIRFTPGCYLYADMDGVIVVEEKI